MTVKELKEKLNRIKDDEMEVCVSPLLEMEIIGEGIASPTLTQAPSPFVRHRAVVVIQSGSVSAVGTDFCLLFGYDDQINLENEFADEFPMGQANTEEFLN